MSVCMQGLYISRLICLYLCIELKSLYHHPLPPKKKISTNKTERLFLPSIRGFDVSQLRHQKDMQNGSLYCWLLCNYNYLSVNEVHLKAENHHKNWSHTNEHTCKLVVSNNWNEMAQDLKHFHHSLSSFIVCCHSIFTLILREPSFYVSGIVHLCLLHKKAASIIWLQCERRLHPFGLCIFDFVDNQKGKNKFIIMKLTHFVHVIVSFPP